MKEVTLQNPTEWNEEGQLLIETEGDCRKSWCENASPSTASGSGSAINEHKKGPTNDIDNGVLI